MFDKSLSFDTVDEVLPAFRRRFQSGSRLNMLYLLRFTKRRNGSPIQLGISSVLTAQAAHITGVCVSALSIFVGDKNANQSAAGSFR